MGKSIVIASGRGGAGKTAVTAHLGTALARRGQNVLLVDADVGMRSLDLALGLESRAVFDLMDVVDGCALGQAIVHDGARPGLALLAGAQLRDSAELTPEVMRELIDRARDMFDWVLIDAPAGAGHGVQCACAGAQSALIVLEPDAPGVRSAQRLAGLLAGYGVASARLVLNRVRPGLARAGLEVRPDAVRDALELDVLALLPESTEVRRATLSGVPLDARGTAGREFDALARRLLGEAPPPELEHGTRLGRGLGALRGAVRPHTT